MELETAETELEDWTVVTASGEIDVAAAPALREQLTELIESGDAHLVIDLDDVDFIDSTGLGVLVGAVRRARGVDGDVRLACSNGRILKVLDIAGLDQVFVIGDSAADAAARSARRAQTED